MAVLKIENLSKLSYQSLITLKLITRKQAKFCAEAEKLGFTVSIKETRQNMVTSVLDSVEIIIHHHKIKEEPKPKKNTCKCACGSGKNPLKCGCIMPPCRMVGNE